MSSDTDSMLHHYRVSQAARTESQVKSDLVTLKKIAGHKSVRLLKSADMSDVRWFYLNSAVNADSKWVEARLANIEEGIRCAWLDVQEDIPDATVDLFTNTLDYFLQLPSDWKQSVYLGLGSRYPASKRSLFILDAAVAWLFVIPMVLSGVWWFGGFVNLAVILFVLGGHEAGHYVVGRRNGIMPVSWNLGVGYVVWQRRTVNGTMWSLRVLPVGGYVEFMEPKSTAPGIRFRVAAAGIGVNALVAVTSFVALLGVMKFTDATEDGLAITLLMQTIMWSLMVAAFNLLPLGPLDGYRILSAALDSAAHRTGKEQFNFNESKAGTVLFAVGAMLLLGLFVAEVVLGFS